MSLRERLLNRPRPFDTYPLRVDDDSEARGGVEQARALLALLQFQGEAADESAIAAAKEELERAEAALAACYEPLILRAMPDDDFEALIGEHKPRPGTDDEAWDQVTFPKACLLATAESDMTEADWQHVMKVVLSSGERRDLCNAAIRINVRAPDPMLPKGWTRTRS